MSSQRIEFVPAAYPFARAAPPSDGSTLPPISRSFQIFSAPMAQYAMSVVQDKHHPAYAPTRCPRYHPDGQGASRDSWINQHMPDTAAKHLETEVEKYWKGQLGQPERRGKCKCAKVPSNFDRSPVIEKAPLVPRAWAAVPPPTALPRFRSSTHAPQVEQAATARNRALCDALAAQLLPRQQTPR